MSEYLIHEAMLDYNEKKNQLETLEIEYVIVEIKSQYILKTKKKKNKRRENQS